VNQSMRERWNHGYHTINEPDITVLLDVRQHRTRDLMQVLAQLHQLRVERAKIDLVGQVAESERSVGFLLLHPQQTHACTPAFEVIYQPQNRSSMVHLCHLASPILNNPSQPLFST
jgi:hypothetical protein